MRTIARLVSSMYSAQSSQARNSRPSIVSSSPICSRIEPVGWRAGWIHSRATTRPSEATASSQNGWLGHSRVRSRSWYWPATSSVSWPSQIERLGLGRGPLAGVELAAGDQPRVR